MHNSKYGNIYYQLRGREKAPVIAFIHGVGMNHKTFNEQVKALEADFRILLWDLPGHGDSTFTGTEQNFTSMAADCLKELLDELDIESVFIVGQSLGSMVAQHFQIKYPSHVLATVHVPGIELTSHVGSWSKAFVPLMMGMFHLFPAKPFYRMFGKHRSVKKDVQEYLSQSIEITGKNLALRITKDMVNDLIDHNPRPELRPQLITYGEKDLFFIRKGAEKWHKKTPGSKCIKIENANHIANQDNPEKFNEAVKTFLFEHTNSGSN